MKNPNKQVSMSFSLFESVKEVFAGEMMNKLAGLLGESQVNLQKALQGTIPSALTGIILKSESTDVHDFFRMVTEAGKIEIPFNLNSLAWWWDKKAVGTDYKSNIFGEKSSGLSDAIALYSGVSRHSASSLLSIAVPGALGVLGKYAAVTKLNANGLRVFLNSQRRTVLNELPAGIFLEGILGFENLTGIGEKIFKMDTNRVPEKSASKWILSGILLLVVLAGTWYFINRPVPAAVPARVLAPVKKMVSTDTPAKAIVPDPRYSIKLPDGTIIFTEKGNLEDQLFQFFKDPNSKPSRRYPYNFDQMDFNKGSTVISNQGLQQVRNVALIFRAFPNSRIIIGGFNSRGGDSIQNKLLYENRAYAVASAIKTAGVNPIQIAGVVSFGSDFAKFPANAPDSIKSKDNRIAISIRSK
jgi:outer membrane protein OmpA-like peptidoglycan-associated protein